MEKLIVAIIRLALVPYRLDAGVLQKVYFHRLWIMTTPADPGAGRVHRCWLRTVRPPYYTGTGVAVKLITRSLRIGLCRPSMDPDAIDTNTDIGVECEALLGYVVEKADIQSWTKQQDLTVSG